jgi:hypothetical protein
MNKFNFLHYSVHILATYELCVTELRHKEPISINFYLKITKSVVNWTSQNTSRFYWYQNFITMFKEARQMNANLREFNLLRAFRQ